MERLSDSRLTILSQAARMKQFNQVLQDSPTLDEISSMAHEILASRRVAQIARESAPALNSQVTNDSAF